MTTSAWQDWIGRTETRAGQAHAEPIAALSATLDRDDPAPRHGTDVPPLWHGVYFTPLTLARDIGPDGHAKRGGFLPPVPLPRRMWAGGRLAFHHPLRVGDDIERVSTVADDTFRREIAPDPVLLFRYSALTFNGHRIHYDRSYVTEVEGYPGLIVHGPLIAALLLDLLRRERPREIVRSFSFRAVSPIFDIHRFTVCGRPASDGGHALWARDHRGALAMEATAETAAA